MSIRSLAALAVARDKASPGQVVGGGAAEAAVVQPTGAARGQPAGTPPEQGGVPQQFVDVLISAIPTEPLAAYTALVSVTVGTLSAPDARAYLPFRWWVYGFFLMVILAAVWRAYYRASRGPAGVISPDNRRRFPIAEALAALVAGAAWGLAMPGSPLNAQLTGTVRTLATAAIIIGAAAVLTLLQAPQLKTGSKTPGEVDNPGGAVSGGPAVPQ
ncbi:MAG: hypothetical protein ACRDRW_05820 [Pseudonocardiaceae bacterium]